MRMFSAVVAMSMVLSACSSDGDAGNTAGEADGTVASPGASPTPAAKVEPVMDESQRKAYADLFGCRFQLQTMETGVRVEVADDLSDQVTAELKVNPGAVADCLRDLDARKQRYGPVPGAAPAPGVSPTPETQGFPSPR